MSYHELLQVIAASSLLTLALTLLLRAFWRQGWDWLQSLLPPRYLKPRPVLRRASAPVPPSAPHE
ncbi:cellulose biosynthesis protein BcsF [Pseudomonas sp. B21-056]|jgi:cellulose biosynthesis operon protein BcsF/YhjT|uniref:cellulose biosynthesis protein BcsF n=1 Tax=Pseudomonas sp. B21-056 TaxID=2895495 RepID=UPI00222EAB33|nr:cellulose biosynthesis protein BcsF [Pseudomonas sp. B21-056]UZE21533.1 cellulose biosynthesis protein BcsF [Pseudomonas sp. B21-056]